MTLLRFRPRSRDQPGPVLSALENTGRTPLNAFRDWRVYTTPLWAKVPRTTPSVISWWRSVWYVSVIIRKSQPAKRRARAIVSRRTHFTFNTVRCITPPNNRSRLIIIHEARLRRCFVIAPEQSGLCAERVVCVRFFSFRPRPGARAFPYRPRRVASSARATGKSVLT